MDLRRQLSRGWLARILLVLFVPGLAFAFVDEEPKRLIRYPWAVPPGVSTSHEYERFTWLPFEEGKPFNLAGRKTLTGDWKGWRSRLEGEGVTVVADYITQIAGNPVGGRYGKVTYTHNFGIWLNFDLEKVVGWTGGSLHLSGNDRAGTSLSGRAIENLFAVQQIFGSETVHLTTLFFEQSLFKRNWNIVIGRINWGDDFAQSPLYCKFQNLGFCGNPVAIPMNVNLSSYPSSAWGVRSRLDLYNQFEILLGLYNTQAGFRAAKYHGVNFNIPSDSGVGFAWELQYDPNRMGGYPGHYKVGGYVDTEPLPEFVSGKTGQAATGVYLAFDQELYRPGPPGSSPNLKAFWTFTWATPETQKLQFFSSAALLYQGLIPGRSEDTAGLGVVWGGFSEDLREQQRQAADEVQTYEMIAEANYEVAPYPWLQIQPSLQYVLRPQGYGSRSNALVVALQMNVIF